MSGKKKTKEKKNGGITLGQSTYPGEDIERCATDVAEEVLNGAMWDEIMVP